MSKQDFSVRYAGDRTGFLLIHGLGGTPTEMRLVARALHRAGRTVHCPQLAGHCAGEAELLATGWRDWSRSVVDELERMRGLCDTVIVGGLSMGAVLAMHVAAVRPDAVNGLALYAPTLWYDGWSIPRYAFLLKWLINTPAGRRYSFVERGQETRTGIELSAHGALTEALRLDASLALLRARASGTGTPAYEGHQLANVPAWRSSVQLDYRLPWWPQVGVQGGWRHAARNPATADGSVRAPAYDVFDAGLRWQGQWGAHPLSVQLGIDNLFDRRYWRDVGSAYGDTYLFPGAPRLARLSLRVGL